MLQPACACSSRHTASEARHGGERMPVATERTARPWLTLQYDPPGMYWLGPGLPQQIQREL